MRKIQITVAIAAIVLLLFAVPVSALGTQSVYTLTQDGNQLSLSQQDGDWTFWEAPNVQTGQSRTGGKIVIQNETELAVDFVLTSVSLPYDNVEALTYLDAVTLTVTDGDTLLYRDRITHLNDCDREPITIRDVAAGESRELSVSVSCAYTYSSSVPSYPSLVWTFSPQVIEDTPDPEDPGTTDADDSENATSINWDLLLKAAGCAVAAALIAGILVKVFRKK